MPPGSTSLDIHHCEVDPGGLPNESWSEEGPPYDPFLDDLHDEYFEPGYDYRGD